MGCRSTHLPWAPRWELFFNAARARRPTARQYEGWGIFDVTRDLGMGIKANRGTLFRLEIDRRGRSRRAPRASTRSPSTTRRTGLCEPSFGCRQELQEEGVRGLEIEYLIKGAEDYDPVYYMLEHTKVVPAFEEWDAYERDDRRRWPRLPAGRAVPVPQDPARVHRLPAVVLRALRQPAPGRAPLRDAAGPVRPDRRHLRRSRPALAVEADGNYDISLHPAGFLRPVVPEAAQAVRRQDARRRQGVPDPRRRPDEGLLERVAAIGADIAEAWSPYPQTTITTADALKVWRGKVGIWGGLPTPVLRESFPAEQFERTSASSCARSRRATKVVIGTGDNFPTDSSWERVRQATRLVEQYGKYPLDLSALPY